MHATDKFTIKSATCTYWF